MGDCRREKIPAISMQTACICMMHRSRQPIQVMAEAGLTPVPGKWTFATLVPDAGSHRRWLSHTTFSRLLDLVCLVAKPFLLTAYAVRYYVLGSPVARWSLRTYLLTREDRFRMRLSQLGPLSPPQAKPFDVPPGVGEREVLIAPVRLPSVSEDLRRGIGACPSIPAVDVPGFMFTPLKAKGRSLERAKFSELIALHLHGG
jgi:hypothetical protein